MSGKTTRSLNQDQHNQSSVASLQNDPNSHKTSDIYKHAYQSLMDIECDPDANYQNASAHVTRAIPPPHRNNMKPVDSPLFSPLRRPHSPSEHETSDPEDPALYPNPNPMKKQHKKTKINNNNMNRPTTNMSNHSSSPSRIYYQSPKQTTNIVPNQIQSVTSPGQPKNANPTTSIKLTEEAKMFAQSRYPFPPFTIRFKTPNIHEQNIVVDLCKSFKEITNLLLELSGYRKSTFKCEASECDLLVFAKNSQSFAMLLNEKNWPQRIAGLPYSRPALPSIPPQLSLIIKNVSLSTDTTNFTNEIKANYTNVHNVIRLKNKFQSNIKLVNVEFLEPNQRDEILNRGKIFVHSLTYDVEEYLAPARVLICSKCMGLGHFRKQCKQSLDTCDKCGKTHNDIKNHSLVCTQLQCIHCQGNHKSNDMKCPVVKQFRADLTKQLLSPAFRYKQQDNNIYLNSTNFQPPKGNPSSITTPIPTIGHSAMIHHTQ
ncbi:unnamed protein product [Rotaria magnacalcarata]|uniref:Gag-like protein n=5 Tax=Rotaria magnacalcarata TaxID=392030 RepID=A0A815YXA8_9BILA|nr:unnamed protein product [Rotaria magnacalcarata]CAF1576136.1 unnamed protein product [Rotaria magnacalcarata]CAF4122896.1 unnamed protein product [Rotaria magnacalcarata]